MAQKSIIYPKISKCYMHVSNRKVIYKGDIDQRSMLKNIHHWLRNPSGSVHDMLHKSAHDLRPNFVRPRVPSQSDHVIWHMVRYNTEAYANI